MASVIHKGFFTTDIDCIIKIITLVWINIIPRIAFYTQLIG